MAPPDPPIESNSRETVLATRALDVGYRRRRAGDLVLLRSVDADLRAGELVCLLGPNGAGKSTLLRSLSGVHAPLGGEVFLGEARIHKMHPRDLARRMSLVLTDRVQAGNLRVDALIAMGRYPYTDWTGRLRAVDAGRIDEAMRRVGIDAMAGRRVDTLSDGEMQKVMIARALAQEPALMLLDEPTAHLDLPNRLEIMSVLRRLAHEAGRAVLLSTHELDLALQTADRIWLIMDDRSLRIDVPEQLVLDGSIERAFDGRSGWFDRATGSFRLRRPHGGRLLLAAPEPVLRFWTRRALERNGWTVGGEEEPEPTEGCVEAAAGADGPRWTLELGGRSRTFERLEPLLEALGSGGEEHDR